MPIEACREHFFMSVPMEIHLTYVFLGDFVFG